MLIRIGNPVEKRYTRNNVVLDAIRSNDGLLGWWERVVGHNVRQLGAHRFQVKDVAPRTSYTYSSADSSLFTLEDCTAVFGGSIVLTSIGLATSIAYELDLATFGSASELWNFLADQYKFDWTVTNITAIRHYLVGADDNRNLLTFTKNTWTDRARAESTKYAGSWGIDNGLGTVPDTGTDTKASGDSATAMADPERVHAFELAPGSTWERLRVEVDLTAAGSCTLAYPAFRVNKSTDPDLVWESGQCAAMIYDDQAGFRSGNAVWTDATGNLLSTPAVVGLGRQQSVVDGLCWRNVQLLGSERSVNLTSDLAAFFDSFEGQTVAKAAFDTASVILPAPTRTRYQLAVMNLWSEVPPLADMPRKARDSDWAETGDWCLDSWSQCPEPQRYVTPGSDEIQVCTPSGDVITEVETGYATGWTVSKHLRQLDNTEVGYLIKWAFDSDTYAKARPWHGYLGVFGLRTVSGGTVSYDVSDSMRHVRAFVQGTEGWAGRGFNVPLPISFADSRVLATSDWLSVRWNRRSASQLIWLATEVSGAVALYRSTNGADTFGLFALIGSGSKPALCVSRSGRVLFFFRDGSGDLKVQVRNSLGAIVTATATAIAGVDDEGCCCYEYPTLQGRGFALLYVSGGNVYRSVSPDGSTWGAGTLIEAGKKPAAYCDKDGRILECWVQSDKIRGRRLNALGGVVNAVSDWVASGVDDDGIAVGCSVGGVSEWRAVLLYSASSALVQKDSYDGSAWS